MDRYVSLLESVKERARDLQIYTDEGIRQIIFEKVKSASDLSLRDRVRIGKRIFNSIRRMDILQPLLDDDEVTDIMVNGAERIFYTRRGQMLQYEDCFESEERLEDLIQQIVGSVNRIVNESSPIVDARLPDGSRVHAVLPPVSLSGALLTIRRFRDEPIRLEDMLIEGTLDEVLADYLKNLVEERKNLFICGGTSSGKTTLLGALGGLIPSSERVVTIEDSAELRIIGPDNLVSMETRAAGPDGRGKITLRDLIRASLRMNPDRLIVGEVRGEEAIDMLSGMNTGHAAMSTGHANSCRDMIRRLESMVWMGMDIPMEAIRMQIASALDYLIYMEKIPGGIRRIGQIMSVDELKEGEILLKTVMDRDQEGMIRWYENEIKSW
ncbi:MAG: CpaF family protein [Erysipelotrichaceae bacterium]|nr:CpaF family protein [Erysipelotrichaceae bacterium]